VWFWKERKAPETSKIRGGQRGGIPSNRLGRFHQGGLHELCLGGGGEKETKRKGLNFFEVLYLSRSREEEERQGGQSCNSWRRSVACRGKDFMQCGEGGQTRGGKILSKSFHPGGRLLNCNAREKKGKGKTLDLFVL